MIKKISIRDVNNVFVEDGFLYMATNDGNVQKYGKCVNMYGDEVIAKTPTGEIVYMLKGPEGGIKTVKKIGDYDASAVISESELRAINFQGFPANPADTPAKIPVIPQEATEMKYLGNFPSGIGKCYERCGTLVKEDGTPLNRRDEGFVQSWLTLE
ncbi:MAG: hypothetical protein V1648_03410 [Candidatus Aenigmatarchaeota archaeon]